MDMQQILGGWNQLASELGEELAVWRTAHPRATLREIEAAVRAALERLQARYLEDLVHASAAANLRQAAAERPDCPDCGGPLEPRGQQVREVLVAHQRVRLRLRRSYARCSACGRGLFPPGRGIGAAAWGVEPSGGRGAGTLGGLDAL
jgi:uncharacterized protein with PIN domain